MLRVLLIWALFYGITAMTNDAVKSLQLPHAVRTPAHVMTALAQDCEALGITSFDVYGDFSSNSSTSYLREFEAEVADEFGKEDAVFMPSGVMAQSIALLIHDEGAQRFACHESSHLLLHEQEAYEKLLHMDPVVISTQTEGSFRSPPMQQKDVVSALQGKHADTLILEIPHRELGGKCTPWSDIIAMRHYCDSHDMKFHCDGARILEATAAYYPDRTLKELVQPFDSVYISFYKGLAGLSGAMLLGSTEFCDQARIWLRRFGGNLYTLLPYAVSGWSGYRKHWVHSTFTFRDKRDKLVRIVQALSDCTCVVFDPKLPQVNMVHGYLPYTNQECLDALDSVEKECGIRVLSRIRPVEETDVAFGEGYRTKFEWTMGEANGAIEDGVFLEGWSALADALEKIKS